MFVPATRDSNFQPDFSTLDEGVLDRTALAYICSPANPQGAVATLERLQDIIRLARKHDFVVVGDECYSEIYPNAPPPGLLEACAAMDGDGKGDLSNVLVFNSLSKRSNVPGLRAGFVAGDAALIAKFQTLRSSRWCGHALAGDGRSSRVVERTSVTLSLTAPSIARSLATRRTSSAPALDFPFPTAVSFYGST